jgi:hypothetical protein
VTDDIAKLALAGACECLVCGLALKDYSETGGYQRSITARCNYV